MNNQDNDSETGDILFINFDKTFKKIFIYKGSGLFLPDRESPYDLWCFRRHHQNHLLQTNLRFPLKMFNP